MKKRLFRLVLALPLLVAVGAASLSAQNHRRVIKTRLTGFQEVPAISSTGRGEFRARLDDDSIEFELSYSNLEGDVQQAHIHLAQGGVNGGITVFLCSNLGNGPAGTPACPQSGTVTGVRMAADMTGGAAAQGLAAGEFSELLRALRSGNTYANVHTTKHTGGEIRGQIRTDDEDNPD